MSEETVKRRVFLANADRYDEFYIGKVARLYVYAFKASITSNYWKCNFC